MQLSILVTTEVCRHSSPFRILISFQLIFYHSSQGTPFSLNRGCSILPDGEHWGNQILISSIYITVSYELISIYASISFLFMFYIHTYIHLFAHQKISGPYSRSFFFPVVTLSLLSGKMSRQLELLK